MNTVQKMREMLQLQDETNSRLNADWRNQPWDFILAARVEAAEALDHLGYKWWSSADPDFAQARMECVDIWHFLLSQMGRMSSEDLDAVVNSIEDQFNYAEMYQFSWRKVPIAAFRNFLVACDERMMITTFIEACVSINLSFDELYKLYIGKAALNRFRWEHDYGKSYKKIWSGREDNEYLTDILNSSTTDLTIDEIKSSLEYMYNKFA